VDLASQYGHVNVLDWWRTKSELELKYSDYAMVWASSNGPAAILDWWAKSGLELRYSRLAIEKAKANGHVAVLEWWAKSGLTFG
jgi:hypothetical protein